VTLAGCQLAGQCEPGSSAAAPSDTGDKLMPVAADTRAGWRRLRRFIPRHDRATESMTVLFADIRDSTSLTESLSSEDAFVLIADFFARSARVIREHRGSVDKYLGDGYMALFPRRVEDALPRLAVDRRADMAPRASQALFVRLSVHVMRSQITLCVPM